MASLIDETVPAEDAALESAPVRGNFAQAKSEIEDLQTGKSDVGHDHDADYSPIGHDHDAGYSPIGHDHAGVYSPVGHDHDADYADIAHDHAGVYSPVGHDHAGVYEPAGVSSTDITDSTADGRALMTSADANPFTDADESKLDGIEAGADVTDATNVAAAGAVMYDDAVAPAAGNLTALGVENGEGDFSNKLIFTGLTAIVVLSDAAYAALSPPDADTLYITTG